MTTLSTSLERSNIYVHILHSHNVNVPKANVDDKNKLITTINPHRTHTVLWFLLLFNPKLYNKSIMLTSLYDPDVVNYAPWTNSSSVGAQRLM